MLRLDVLGSIALSRADGVPVRSVLAQPKRLALLAYLASSHPPASHPRDALLALLWPELDQERARRALRQALHGLRKSLGPGVITGKGHEMVGVDSERLRCDVVSFSRAVEDGRDAEALELYRGDFLQGFHVSGVPEFEHWSERRGRELRLAAVDVAWRVVETAEAAGRTGEARRAGERALELDPFGGETVRRYLGLMDRLGQPADAIRAYQSYAERLQQELDLAPSPETRALAETIREGGGSSEGWERSSVGRDAAESPHEPSPEDDSENLVAEAGDRPTESGPETGPRTGPPGSPGRLRRSLFRRRAAIGVPIAALLGVFAYAGLNESESSGPAVTDRPIRSVAVLPFADLSPAGDQQWFGDGVAEEILDVLARIEPLQVTARSSSFQFEGRNVDVRALGDSLGVGAVLEGSVRRAGNRVRITVQLVRTSDGTHLWSESYDRALTSETIFVTQEEIARSVADALEVELGLTTPALRVAERPAGLEAYSLYLQARHAIRERTGEGRGRALPLIREALEHDPNFARAWALLARWHVQAPFWEPFDGAVDLETSRARSLQAARRALELAPDLAEAHATLGFVLDHHHRWTEAWSHHSRALELDPGFPEARAYALWHLGSRGEWEAALEHARVRQRLDPLHVPSNGNLAGMLMYAGRFDESAAQWRRTIELSGDRDAHARFVRSLEAKLFALQGRIERAVTASREAYEFPGPPYQPRRSYYQSHLAAMRALAGGRPASHVLLDSLLAEDHGNVRAPLRWLRAFDVARVHAALGQADSAFTWLGRSRPDRWRSLEITRFRADPWWAPLRDDPRYRELLEALEVA